MVKRKYGVAIGEKPAEKIEEYRVRLDGEGNREILSRSEAIRELTALGLVVNDLIENSELDLERGKPREAYARQALLNELRRDADAADD